MNHRILVSNLGLLGVLVVGVAYILLGVVRIDPRNDRFTILSNWNDRVDCLTGQR
jgi:hypothetical protein